MEELCKTRSLHFIVVYSRDEHNEQYTFLVSSFYLGTHNLQTYLKGLKVKVENHTKIANCENKQKSKMPSLISPWLGGRKEKMSETRSLLQFNIK